MFVAYFYLPCVLNRPSRGNPKDFFARGPLDEDDDEVGPSMNYSCPAPPLGKSNPWRGEKGKSHSLMSLMPGAIDILLKDLHRRTGVAHN